MTRFAETEVRPSEHKGWVLQWKTPPMPAPAFAYYTTEFEARSHEAVNEQGIREVTTLLLPEEY